tara:strand:- start:28 stop:219 length:192 start_codon:yes stop_codon:yes gene_type:complete
MAFNKKFNSKNPLKYGGTSGKEVAYSSAYKKGPLGYSPIKQNEEVPMEEIPVEKPELREKTVK